MPPTSKKWEDLVADGWMADQNSPNNLYFQPSGKRVSRKRDLSIQERIDYGEILFPSHSKVGKVCTSGNVSLPSTSSTGDTLEERGISMEVEFIKHNNSKTRCVRR